MTPERIEVGSTPLQLTCQLPRQGVSLFRLEF